MVPSDPRPRYDTPHPDHWRSYLHGPHGQGPKYVTPDRYVVPMSTTRNNSHDRLSSQEGLTSHDRGARTILRRIRSTRSSSAPDTAFVAADTAFVAADTAFVAADTAFVAADTAFVATDTEFVAAEQALLSVGVRFTVVEAPALINPALINAAPINPAHVDPALVNPASPGLASVA